MFECPMFTQCASVPLSSGWITEDNVSATDFQLCEEALSAQTAETHAFINPEIPGVISEADISGITLQLVYESFVYGVKIKIG